MSLPAPVVAVERWFVSERVWTGPGARERHLAIGVGAGRVVEMVEGGAPEGTPSGAVRDWGRRPLVPSFVNAHVHLAMAPLRGITDVAVRQGNVVSEVFFAIESHLQEGDVRAFARLGAYESLLAGVGEVWDHYYAGLEVAEALSDVGLSGVVAPTLQDRSGPGMRGFERALDETRRLHEDVALRARGIVAALGPHATDTVSDVLLGRAADAAAAMDLPIHLHLAQAASEMPGATADVVARLLEHARGRSLLVAHGLFLSAADIARLVDASAVLAFCPLSQLQFGFLGPLGGWVAAGGGWGLGTDTVASNDALSVQRELPLVAGWGSLEASFSPERARLARSGSAEDVRALEATRVSSVGQGTLATERLLEGAFGYHLPRHAQLGPRGLVVGAAANFQVLEPEAPELFPGDDVPRSLAHGETSGAIHALVVRGRELGTAGDFRRSLLGSVEYRDARAEAERRRSLLWARAATRSA
ncbi:MAG TPA: amidohydrolase family protein [Polyangiaceae bacterium]|nr:amidohydrolase family protein [Polyangiaceae bacterium]